MTAINRSCDFKDFLVATQKGNDQTPPLYAIHFPGLSIAESNVFASGAALLASIKGTPSAKWLTHIAIGTDDTPIDPATQTALIVERYRDQLSLWNSIVPVSAGPCTYLTQIYIPAALCTYHIKEIGVFGDDGATLFCRQLLDFDNSGADPEHPPIDLTVSWLLTFLATGSTWILGSPTYGLLGETTVLG